MRNIRRKNSRPRVSPWLCLTFVINSVLVTHKLFHSFKLANTSEKFVDGFSGGEKAFVPKGTNQPKTCVITIASWNKYGVVRTLFDTVKESNPQISCFIWYVANDDILSHHANQIVQSLTQLSFHIITAGEVVAKLKDYSIKQAAFLLSANEFVVALKPFAFKYTFHVQGAMSAIYLDSDIWVGDSLAGLENRLTTYSGVFVQYSTTNTTPDLSNGGNDYQHPRSIFDVGVLALSNRRPSLLLEALDGWVRLCKNGFLLSKDNTFQVTKECRYSFISAIFVESDDYYVIQDSKYMVSSWNLPETCAGLHIRDGRLHYLDMSTQKDHPIAIFHFSGMSLTDTGGNRAIITQDNTTQYSDHDFLKLRTVFDAYMERVTKYSALEYRSIPYGFQHFANINIEIEPWIRLRYADMTYVDPQEVEKDPKLLPDYRSPYTVIHRPRVSKALFHEWVHPDPFCPSLAKCQGSNSMAKYKMTYLEWLASGPHHMSANMEGQFYYSETMHYVWEKRKDLQEVFPDPTGGNYSDYMDWFERYAGKEKMVSAGIFRLWRETRDYHRSHHWNFHHSVTPRSEIGVNIFGWHLTTFGLAQVGVNMVNAVRSVDGKVTAIHQREVNKVHFRPESLHFPLSRSCSEAVNFLVLNPDNAPYVLSSIPNVILQNKYNIAWWFWELDQLPPTWMQALADYDEVWLPSQFVLDAILQTPGYNGTPLKVLPAPIERPSKGTPSFADIRGFAFQVPADAFLFLVTFDFESYVERKNPMAAIQAFRSAFPIAEDPSHMRQLIVKSVSGKPEQIMALKTFAADDPRIQFVSDVLPEQELKALQRRTDCYVSLHRSEGYGMNIAEAMLGGVPVIATNYSGNVGFFEPLQEFMGTCQFAVPYELVKLTVTYGPYGQGNRWAEADHDFAVNAMKIVVQNNCKSQHGPKMAQAFIDRFGLKAVGRRFQDLLTQSYPLIAAKQNRTTAHGG